MDTDSFWTLLEDSRQHGFDGGSGGGSGVEPGTGSGSGYGSGGGPDARAGRLRDSLALRPPAAIVGFQARLDTLTDAASTWDLWAAADLVFGGWCSDDAFRSFQHWVMGLGRNVFSAAVADPDSLAGAPGVRRLSGRPMGAWTVAERPAWPALDTVGLAAYELATGPSDDFGDAFYAAVRAARLTDDGDPAGHRWTARDEGEAARRLPRLSAAFPLGPLGPLGPSGPLQPCGPCGVIDEQERRGA